MKYFSTNKNSPTVDFIKATIEGQAPDKGLYFPEKIPSAKHIITNISTMSNEDIALEVIKPYVGDTIANGDLKKIVEETVSFPIPLVRVTDRISSLELFHGPTLAFKDIGARFMSRCLRHFVQDDKKIVVLVATSGDTGSAVANGFFNVEGVEVVVLYPSGKVSNVQEKQLTTYGRNIHAIEVNGSFDDCQAMVKNIFSKKKSFENILLTSANSINIARWLPQQFYYFFAYRQWEHDDMPVISVPSGNFGNIAAGILAWRSGLPIKHFVAASNSNDVVPRYFHTRNYDPRPTIQTMSNAMDVGNPSNISRIMEMFAGIPEIKKWVSAVSVTEQDTRNSIQQVYRDYKYLLDPHGAVGYFALNEYLEQNPVDKGIFLSTAHPVKFLDVVEPVIGKPIDLPAQLNDILKLEKKSTKMEVDPDELAIFIKQI